MEQYEIEKPETSEMPETPDYTSEESGKTPKIPKTPPKLIDFKNYDLKCEKDVYFLRMEIYSDDNIQFTLRKYNNLSLYHYNNKFNYNDIIKLFLLQKENFKDINKIFKFFDLALNKKKINLEYDNQKNLMILKLKKLLKFGEVECKLDLIYKMMPQNEMISILIEEIKDIKNNNKKDNNGNNIIIELKNEIKEYKSHINNLEEKIKKIEGEIKDLRKQNNLFNSLVNKIFLQKLHEVFFFFDYSFNADEKELNKEIYINNLIELFVEDKHLIKLMDEKIMENINKNNEKNEIVEKMIEGEKFLKDDIIIDDIVQKLLNKNYLNEFKILYLELEKNYYFSSLLYYKKRNDNNDKYFYQIIKETFIKNIDIKNKILEHEKAIDIIIGFNLPSKDLIEEIIFNIDNNIINQYRKNEEEFKNKYFEKEEEFIDAEEQYENSIELYKEIAQKNIMKNNILKKIEAVLPKGEKHKFYSLLFEDYLLTFINKNFKELKYKSLINIKSFLKIILENKFNLNDNYINLLGFFNRFNWIESYSKEIVLIIKIYIFLNLYIEDDELNKKIKETISEINQEYKNKYYNNNNIKIINSVFYIIIDALINIFISGLNQIFIKIKSQESLSNLLNDLNNIYHSLLSINIILNLNNEQLNLLHKAIKIMSLLSFNDNEEKFEKNKKILIDFIQKETMNKNKEIYYLNNINNEKVDVVDVKEEQLLKIKLDNFYGYFKEKNNNNFASLFSSILFDEFNEEYNEKYTQYILKIILNDANLIQNNISLIKLILSKYIKLNEENIDVALENISKEEIYFPLLNSCNKEIVNNAIIKIFDIIINTYFNSLDGLEELITSNLFDIFEEYLRILDDKEYDKYYNKFCNEKLIKILIISFIKIYLYNLVNIIYYKRNSLKGKEKGIIMKISEYSPILNTIKIYFIILLYNKTKTLSLLKDESYEPIEEYTFKLKKEIGANNFYNILITSKNTKR